MQGFGERLAAASERVGTTAMVGLDPHLSRLPRCLGLGDEAPTDRAGRAAAAAAVQRFNDVVIEAVADLVPAVKPQLAFYEALGAAGWAALEHTCARAREAGLLVVADGKRGDISSTAAAYARAILDPDGPVGADALTINPWMGSDTLNPYMELVAERGRGLFVLVRTTNPGSSELQLHGDQPACHTVCAAIAARNQRIGGDGLGPIGAVVGASSAGEAASLRARMPRAWFLVPGVGAQGGSMRDGVAGARSDGLGALVNSSRGVLFGPESMDPGATLDDVGAAVRARARVLAQGVRSALEG